MKNKPYKQKIIKNKIIREFSLNEEDKEFIWHADKNDRLVKIIEGKNWKFQLYNKLPIELKENFYIFIKNNNLHRIIKGNTPLKIEIMENFDLKQYLKEGILLNESIILKEEDEQELDDLAKEISSAFAQELSSLKGQQDIVKEQVEEAEVNLDEAIGSLLFSILLSTPKLIELLGKLINKISGIFKKDKDQVSAGDAFIHAGHTLEKKYIGILKGIIKLTGIAKKAGIKDEDSLDKAAHVLLYSILAVAAVSAGMATIESIGGFLKGKGVTSATYGLAKGGLASIKAEEIITGVKQLLPKV